MPAACDRSVKTLRSAELDARISWRDTHRNVACNRELRRRGFCRIRLARGGNYYCGWRGQIGGSGVHSVRCDCSGGGASGRNAIHAPAHTCVCGICHSRSKCLRVPQQNRSARGGHGHSYGWSRWRRRREYFRSCGSSAAWYPTGRKQKDERQKFAGRSREARSPTNPFHFHRDLRERSHAGRNAGEGPAKGISARYPRQGERLARLP